MTSSKPMVPWIRDLWANAICDENGFQLGRQFLCHMYAKNVLHDPLGILCELAVRNSIIPEGHWAGDEGIIYFKRYAGEQGVLPKEVVEWANLSSQVPTVRLNLRQRRELDLPKRYRFPGEQLRPIALSAVNDYGEPTRENLAELIMRL